MITKLNAKACDSLKIYRKCYLVLLISTDQVHYGNIKENFILYVYFTLYTIFWVVKNDSRIGPLLTLFHINQCEIPIFRTNYRFDRPVNGSYLLKEKNSGSSSYLV